MHARRAIVNAAAAALVGLPATGDRVHPGRAWPLQADTPAYLLVYARSEQSAPATMKGPARKLQRQVRLVVEGVDAGVPDADDDAALDDIAEQVEAALASDPTLGGACLDLHLGQTDIAVTTDENERRLGRVRLEFAVTYFTAANAPGVAT